jgi:hypothetical protein
MMQHYVHARLHPGRDDDLITWLESWSVGGRSEAIRALLRDGLRMRQMELSMASIVRQAIKETLGGLQVAASQEHAGLDANEVEEEFGAQLDELLGRFG